MLACAVFAACCGLIFFPSLLNRTLGGGARFRRPSRDRTLSKPCQPTLLAEEKEAVPDDLAVNGTGNAVLELEIHLWNRIFGENGGIRDIACNTSHVN